MTKKDTFLPKSGKLRIFFVFIFLYLVCASGCSSIREFTRQFVKKPTYAFQDHRYQKMDFFESVPVFRIRVKNDNQIPLRIRNISYNLRIANNKFVRGIREVGSNVPAQGTKVVELTIPFSHGDLFETSEEFMQTRKVDYYLYGTIGVGVFEVPYFMRGNFDIPFVPSLTGVSFEKEKKTNHYAMILEIENPNSFPLAIEKLKGELLGNEKDKPYPFSVFEITISGNASAGIRITLPKEFFSGKDKKDFPFTVSGIFSIKDGMEEVLEFPFSYSEE